MTFDLLSAGGHEVSVYVAGERIFRGEGRGDGWERHAADGVIRSGDKVTRGDTRQRDVEVVSGTRVKNTSVALLCCLCMGEF